MSEQDPLNLSKNKIPVGLLAPLQVFQTRAGETLSYRVYPAWSPNLLILYHGIGSDSRYLCLLASMIAKEELATVVTADFRGHGESLGLSDELRPNQLEQDLEELLIRVRQNYPGQSVYLGGHSMGGGFALKIAYSSLSSQFQGFLPMAPYLPLSYATCFSGYGGWITVEPGGEYVHVNMPDLFKTGKEKLRYSMNYMRSVAIADGVDLKSSSHGEMTVVWAESDQVFSAPKFKETFWGNQKTHCLELKGADHLTMVARPDHCSDIAKAFAKMLRW